MKPAVPVELTSYAAGQATGDRWDEVAAEEPLEIRIEGGSVAVTMRTPGHDRELVAGFLLSENLLRHRSELFDITQCGAAGNDPEDRNVANVTLTNPSTFDRARLTRNVFSSSSCGVCGKGSIEAVTQQFPPLNSTIRVPPDLLLRLPSQLADAQETFQRTGGLHACALFDCEGNLVVLREDVGRHNALDKVLGYAFYKDLLPLDRHILLLSGRVSFEMVQKALAGGIAVIAAISAPTSLAVEFARANDQTLIGFLREDRMNVYTASHRVVAGR